MKSYNSDDQIGPHTWQKICSVCCIRRWTGSLTKWEAATILSRLLTATWTRTQETSSWLMIHEAVTSGSLHVLITTDHWLVVSVASKFHSVSMSVYRKWKVRVFERKGVSINFVTCDDEMVMLFRSYITLLLRSYLSMLPVYCDWELRRPYYHQRRKVSCFERVSLIWFLTPSFLSQFTNIRERQTISMVWSFYFWVCRFKERRYNNRLFLLFEIPSLYMVFIAIVIQV